MKERIADWASKLRFEFVNKYIKIWHDNTICLFVVNTLTDKKFSYGDILKQVGEHQQETLGVGPFLKWIQ